MADGSKRKRLEEKTESHDRGENSQPLKTPKTPRSGQSGAPELAAVLFQTPLSTRSKSQQTPSGSILTGKVGNTRTIFSPKGVRSTARGVLGLPIQPLISSATKVSGPLSVNRLCDCDHVKCEHEESDVNKQVGAQGVNANHQQFSLNLDQLHKKQNISLIVKTNARSKEQPLSMEDQSAQNISVKQTHISQFLTPATPTNEIGESIKDQRDLFSPKEGLKEAVTTGPDNTVYAASNMETPKSMDLCTVIAMFNKIEASMKTMEGQLNKIQNQDYEGKTRILTTAQQATNVEVQDLRKELEMCKINNIVLNGTVGRLAQELSELKLKLNLQETDKAKKRMLMLTGFEASDKQNIMISQLSHFFQEEMQIDITIEDAFQIGETKPRQIVITVSTPEDRSAIFENVYRVKDYTNSQGKKMYFKNYFCSSSNEKRKKQQDIQEIVKSIDEVHRPDLAFENGVMKIDGNEYRKQVQPPNPTDILQMDTEYIAMLLQIPVQRSEKIVAEGNTLVAYAVDATTYQQVQQAYMHVKLNNANARHIVAAWSLPGQPEYEKNDYCDDQEHGIGRFLLEILQTNRIKQKAIFVARYTGEKKIGNLRYELYYQVVQQAVNRAESHHGTPRVQSYEDYRNIKEKAQQEKAQRRKQNRKSSARNKLYSDAIKYHNSDTRGGSGRGARGKGGPTRGGARRQYMPRNEETIKKEQELRKEARKKSANVNQEEMGMKNIVYSFQEPSVNDWNQVIEEESDMEEVE